MNFAARNVDDAEQLIKQLREGETIKILCQLRKNSGNCLANEGGSREALKRDVSRLLGH